MNIAQTAVFQHITIAHSPYFPQSAAKEFVANIPAPTDPTFGLLEDWIRKADSEAHGYLLQRLTTLEFSKERIIRELTKDNDRIARIDEEMETIIEMLDNKSYEYAI